MTAYFVDDGGDDSDGSTWAKAFVSFATMIGDVPAALTTSGNIIYVGHTHNNPTTGAHQVLTGPTSRLPVFIISCDQTNGTPTYLKGTGKQVDSTDGAYNITFDGSFALFGLRIVSGGYIYFSSDANEYGSVNEDVTCLPGDNMFVQFAGAYSSYHFTDLTIDCSADTVNRTQYILRSNNQANSTIVGLTLSNVSKRTGTFAGGSAAEGALFITGADLSGLPAGTELIDASFDGPDIYISNAITADPVNPATGVCSYANALVLMTNIGPASAPVYIYHNTAYGLTVGSSSIYRTGGATINSVNCGWNITTSAYCGLGSVYQSPWIYGNIASTGSKTFTLYITNDTADFDDDEVWLEVEYAGTANEAIWSNTSDRCTTVLTTPAPQTDDAASTWNGAGPAFTFKQSLAASGTVNVTGQYRARVCVGKASILGASYFYVDPKVTVS